MRHFLSFSNTVHNCTINVTCKIHTAVSEYSKAYCIVHSFIAEKEENRIYSMDGRSRRWSCREAVEVAAAVGSVGIVVDVEGSKAGPKILPIILDCFLLNFGGLFFPLTKRVEDPSVGWTFILRRGIATTDEDSFAKNTFKIHLEYINQCRNPFKYIMNIFQQLFPQRNRNFKGLCHKLIGDNRIESCGIDLDVIYPYYVFFQIT